MEKNNKTQEYVSSSEESEFEESDYEEPEEIKKIYEELIKKHYTDDTKTKYDYNGFDRDGKHKDTKTKYDSNGFDRDGKHKDTGIFLSKKSFSWLKDEHEFLGLYNEIIKNGEFSEKTSKRKSISSYALKKFLESILNGKIDNNKIFKKIKIINEIENDLNDSKENENINKLKNYIKKIRNSIYGKDKEKIKTDQAKSFEDQKRKRICQFTYYLI